MSASNKCPTFFVTMIPRSARRAPWGLHPDRNPYEHSRKSARTPLPRSARPLFAAGDLRPSEFRAASSLPCQVPSRSPLGAPVEPDRPLASSVRLILELWYPSPVQTPLSSLHQPRSHPAGSSASRFP